MTSVLRFTLMVSLFVCAVNTKSMSAASTAAEKEARVQIMRRTMRDVEDHRSTGHKSSYDDEL